MGLGPFAIGGGGGGNDPGIGGGSPCGGGGGGGAWVRGLGGTPGAALPLATGGA